MTGTATTTWTVDALIDALFTVPNRQSAKSSWKNIQSAYTASPKNYSALVSNVNGLTKWTLTHLAQNELLDPDGTGPLNPVTGAMKLLAMVYDYAGISPTEIPTLPAGSDMSIALITPTTPDTTVTSSLGDGQAVVPSGTFSSTVLLLIARQPESFTVNTPYPAQSRVFDISIAPEVSFTPFGVVVCPFTTISSTVNNRAVIAHQRSSDGVTEYLPRASSGTLICPESVGSAWREEDGTLRQRLAQAGSLLRSALSLVTPTSAYAGHAAIGASLTELSPSVIVDPYVATTLTMPAVTGATYGASVPVSATLTTAGGVAIPNASIAFTRDGDASTTQTATTNSSGVASVSYSQLSTGSHTVATSYAGFTDPSNAPVYGASSSSVTFTVAPATLSVTADNLTREYGLANPTLTGTLTGVQYGDAITASYSTTATVSSPVGPYPIVPTLNATSAVLANYTVSITNGTLSVTKAPLSVTFVSRSILYPDGPGCVVTYAGFRLSDAPSSLGGSLTCSRSTGLLTDPFPVGTYTVTPGGLTSGNYTITFVPGTITVTRLYGQLVFKSPVSLGDQRASYQRGNNIPVAFRLYERDNVTIVANAVATVAMEGVSIPPGSRTFTYDPTTNLYQTNIKTSSTTTLGTHRITISLDDGTTRWVDVDIK